MTLPSCPWRLGERIHDPWLFEETHYGCGSCFTPLGLQLEPVPAPSAADLEARSGVDTTPGKV